MRHLLGLHRCRLPEESGMSKEREGKEVKSGSLCLLQTVGHKTRRIAVHVKVYRNCFEHYAVVSKDHFFCHKCTFINLRNCFVLPGNSSETELRIVPNNFEGTAIVFDTEEVGSVDSWMEVLQSDCPPSSPKRISSPNLSPVIPRSPILQTLIETDEEE